jgi:anti-anti-sigma factor
MQTTMQVQIVRTGKTLRILVSGPVDNETTPQLRTQVQQAWTRSLQRLELDFAAVDYISSPGIALLLEFRQWLARDHVPVQVTAASIRVKEVLATCRLDGLFLADGNDETRVPAAG